MDNIQDTDTPDYLDKCWMTKHLLETKDIVGQKFSTFRWLQMLDADTLEMINQYITKVEKIEENIISSKNVEELEDIAFLIGHCAALELDMTFFDYVNSDIHNQKHNKIIDTFNIFVSCESLIRKNLLQWKGQGKITDAETTFFSQTELGKKLFEYGFSKKNKGV